MAFMMPNEQATQTPSIQTKYHIVNISLVQTCFVVFDVLSIQSTEHLAVTPQGVP